MSTVYDEVSAMLTERFEVPAGQVRPEATFAMFEMDSLSVEEFQMVITDRFGMELWDGGVDLELTLAQAVARIEGSGRKA